MSEGATGGSAWEVWAVSSHGLDTGGHLWHDADHMSVVRPRSTFGDQLRAELVRKDMSIRKLSRLMAPEKPEHARRALAKWISGKTKPSLASRHLVADTLGVDRSVFDDEDDDEEEDLYAALTVAMRAVARHEAEKLRSLA